MWWRDLVNRLVHGQPLPWHISILWRCEECGGTVFQRMAWDYWTEGETVNRRFALKCVNCGRLEANMVVTVPLW